MGWVTAKTAILLHESVHSRCDPTDQVKRRGEMGPLSGEDGEGANAYMILGNGCLNKARPSCSLCSGWENCISNQAHNTRHLHCACTHLAREPKFAIHPIILLNKQQVASQSRQLLGGPCGSHGMPAFRGNRGFSSIPSRAR